MTEFRDDKPKTGRKRYKPNGPRCSGRHQESIELKETCTGSLELPRQAFERILKFFGARILQPNLSHVTSDCPARLNMKERLQTFVTTSKGIVEIRSRATAYIMFLLRKVGYSVTCIRPALSDGLQAVIPSFGYTLLTPDCQKILTNHHCGQIRVGSRADVVNLVADLVRAFPQAPFLFPFHNRQLAEEFARQLRLQVKQPVHVKCGLKPHLTSRLTVCTFWAAKGLELMDCPAVIFPCWPGTLHEWVKGCALNPWRERMYLIRTMTDRITRADEEELLHRIGPLFLDLAPLLPLAQHMLHTVKFGKLRHHTPARPNNDYRRNWNHSRRNQLLAALGREIARHQQSDAAAASPGSSIAILVGTLEHARLLEPLLEGWPVIQGDATAKVLPTRMIVTLTAAASLQNFRPEWLVYGMGGPPSPWLTSLLKQCSRAGHTVRIVDLTDGFDGHAAALARARHAEILAQNCNWRPLQSSVLKPAQDCLRNLCRGRTVPSVVDPNKS